jgi:hypothetical protein
MGLQFSFGFIISMNQNLKNNNVNKCNNMGAKGLPVFLEQYFAE